MNGQRTNSILERAPEILAVTAASYGLPAPSRAQAQAGRSDKDNARAQRERIGPFPDRPRNGSTRTLTGSPATTSRPSGGFSFWTCTCHCGLDPSSPRDREQTS